MMLVLVGGVVVLAVVVWRGDSGYLLLGVRIERQVHTMISVCGCDVWAQFWNEIPLELFAAMGFNLVCSWYLVTSLYYSNSFIVVVVMGIDISLGYCLYLLYVQEVL